MTEIQTAHLKQINFNNFLFTYVIPYIYLSG